MQNKGKGSPFNLSDIPAPALTKLLPDLDGHTIFDPRMFLEAGISDRFVKSVSMTHRSSKTDPKGMIFTDQGVVKELAGVYSLTFLYAVADLLGITQASGARSFYGRGSQAQALKDEIARWIKDNQQ